MYKLLFGLVLTVAFTLPTRSQSDDNEKITSVINTFFKGLHMGDTVLIRETVTDSVIMQSIHTSANGKNGLHDVDFGNFLKNIVSIDREKTKIEEKLTAIDIKIDGSMANVWTPYRFYVNGNLSHCGANSFQLFKNDDANWKIFYIIDTRRKENCE